MSSTYSSSVASSSSTGFTSISASSSSTSLLSDVEKIGILDALLDKVKPTPPKAPDAKGKGRADPTADLLSRIADWSTASTLPPQQQLLIRLVLISETFDPITTIRNVESRTRLIAWLTRIPPSEPSSYRDLPPEHWEMIFRYGVAGMSADERDSFWARFVSVGVFCLDVAFNHLPLWSPHTVESGRLRTVPIRSLSNAIAFGDSKLESTTGIISIDLRLSQWISAGGGGPDVPLCRVTELALYDDTPDEAKIVYIPNLERLSDLKTLKLDNFLFPAEGNRNDFAPLVPALRPTLRKIYIRTWKKHRMSPAFVVDLLASEIPFENIDLVYSDSVVSDTPYGNRRGLPPLGTKIERKSLVDFKCGPLPPADFSFVLNKFKFNDHLSLDVILFETEKTDDQTGISSRKRVLFPGELKKWTTPSTLADFGYDLEKKIFTVVYGIPGSFTHRICIPDALGSGKLEKPSSDLWQNDTRIKRLLFPHVTAATFRGRSPDRGKWMNVFNAMPCVSSIDVSGEEAIELAYALSQHTRLCKSISTVRIWDNGSTLHVPSSATPAKLLEARQYHSKLLRGKLISFLNARRKIVHKGVPNATPMVLCSARYNQEPAVLLYPDTGVLTSVELELRTDALFDSGDPEKQSSLSDEASNSWLAKCQGV
ncbi:hypothetical protein SISNIDRAFT_468307 [Sistotremastrum niveocremeum HHB9708]|uniref:Uncharacterized protein n=1 Tax=Sistotremastrum niveocremeum HHB9708 TaxID=1314777 RepID=A0A164RR53_9AGAM|nr:hypothetical protein SISNIDRAFT_468307 [Sistotremastrum niveocremeum HHB9708]